MRSYNNVSGLAAELRGHGYALSLDPQGRLKVKGPTRLPDEITRRITESRDALAALVLLEQPPAWLSEVLRRYYSGQAVHTRRGGQDVTLRVDARCLAANVATGMGRDPTTGPQLRPAVEAALAALDGAKEAAM